MFNDTLRQRHLDEKTAFLCHGVIFMTGRTMLELLFAGYLPHLSNFYGLFRPRCIEIHIKLRFSCTAYTIFDHFMPERLSGKA